MNHASNSGWNTAQGGGFLRILGIIYLVKTIRRRREERRRQQADAAEDS